MEALGASAAISQFIAQFIATINLVYRLKGSTECLKRYQEQLEGLRYICEDISNNPALSTPGVQREIQSIVHIIRSNKDASILLKKGSFHRAIAFVLKERSFVDLLATLEIKKTALLLCVQSVTSLAVHNIYLSITSMDNNTRENRELTPPRSPKQNEMPHQKAVYRSNTAGHNVDQHNGDYFEDPKLKSGSPTDTIDTKYFGNKKMGDGLQVNGLTAIYSKAEPLENVPKMGGEWIGNTHEGTKKRSTTSKQICGRYIVWKEGVSVEQESLE